MSCKHRQWYLNKRFTLRCKGCERALGAEESWWARQIYKYLCKIWKWEKQKAFDAVQEWLLRFQDRDIKRFKMIVELCQHESPLYEAYWIAGEWDTSNDLAGNRHIEVQKYEKFWKEIRDKFGQEFIQ